LSVPYMSIVARPSLTVSLKRRLISNIMGEKELGFV
jgi:hypothetical protein